MALQGIRKYLNDNGINDQDIGYDNGRVTVKGKGFINATPQAQDDPTQGLMKDSTYANTAELTNALKQYRAGDRSTQLNNTINTIGQKTAAQPFQFQQTQKPFQYNAQSDPAYQAALRQAQQNSQTASGNIAADMNKRGLLNSTITQDRGNQAAQAEYSRVSDTVLPQLMQQAYTKYQDQNNNDYRTALANYQAQQDQVKNLTGYAGLLNGQVQQDFTNDLATNQDARAAQAQDFGQGVTKAGLTGYYDDYSGVKKKMAANSAAWSVASPEEQQRLHDDNVKMASSIGATYDPQTGDYNYSQGLRTLAGQQFDAGQDMNKFQRSVAEAGLTGMYGDKPTMSKVAQDAGFTGEFNGAPTLQGRQINASISHMQNQDSIASTKANKPSGGTATQIARGFEGQVMDEIGQFDNPTDIDGWLSANRGEITKQLGTAGYERIKKSALSQYQSADKAATNQQKSDLNARSKAISLAKDDPRWLDTKQDKQAIIKEYEALLNQ